MKRGTKRTLLGAVALSSAALALPAAAGYFPMHAAWPQADGPGSAIELSYSFSNLLDGSLRDSTGASLPASLLRSAFEHALWDYAAVLPIHFVERVDAGPLPESGDYDPAGLADIRIGQVAHIDGANAYAYFPYSLTSGLAGDVVFSATRSGAGWTPLWVYAVAQHELGHALGMGHYVDADPLPDAAFAELTYDGPLFPLDAESVAALQAVYGSGSGSVTPLSAVPEPASALMWTAGALLLAGNRHFRRARK
jgi:hypothetical protein